MTVISQAPGKKVNAGATMALPHPPPAGASTANNLSAVGIYASPPLSPHFEGPQLAPPPLGVAAMSDSALLPAALCTDPEASDLVARRNQENIRFDPTLPRILRPVVHQQQHQQQQQNQHQQQEMLKTLERTAPRVNRAVAAVAAAGSKARRARSLPTKGRGDAGAFVAAAPAAGAPGELANYAANVGKAAARRSMVLMDDGGRATESPGPAEKEEFRPDVDIGGHSGSAMVAPSAEPCSLRDAGTAKPSSEPSAEMQVRAMMEEFDHSLFRNVSSTRCTFFLDPLIPGHFVSLPHMGTSSCLAANGIMRMVEDALGSVDLSGEWTREHLTELAAGVLKRITSDPRSHSQLSQLGKILVVLRLGTTARARLAAAAASEAADDRVSGIDAGYAAAALAPWCALFRRHAHAAESDRDRVVPAAADPLLDDYPVFLDASAAVQRRILPLQNPDGADATHAPPEPLTQGHAPDAAHAHLYPSTATRSLAEAVAGAAARPRARAMSVPLASTVVAVVAELAHSHDRPAVYLVDHALC